MDDDTDQHYIIECLRKKFPAYLDGEKVSTTKPGRLNHRSQLVVGPFNFDIHIHTGSNTCKDCEPGILNNQNNSDDYQQRLSVAQRRLNHREEMRTIRKKLGLNEVTPNPTHSSLLLARTSQKLRRVWRPSSQTTQSQRQWAGCCQQFRYLFRLPCSSQRW